MSWEILGNTRDTDRAGVTIASSAGSARMPALLTITVRMDRLPGDLGFLQRGGPCQVLFGRDTDAGRMRIVAGRGSKLYSIGGGSSLSLRVKLPDGIAPAKRGPEPVEFTHSDDWIEITLPTWAIAVERITKPSPAARTSIMERVPDPAAELRGRNGR